jgi:hypothetical protein
MSYREFVKENFHSLGDMPAKEKMKKLGEMWRKHTGKAPMAKKMKGKGKGAGMFSDILGSVGLGVEPQKKGGRMRRVRGKGLLSGPLSIFGLGFPEGGDVAGGDVAGGDVAGSGILSDTLGAFGLGVKKRGRPVKGKGVAGGKFGAFHNDIALANGGGFFSNALSAFGLGMPNNVKVKHFNRMKALEKQMHEKGKLTPAQHNKLKVYHTLHGAGFFDSLFRGIKRGASAVASVIPAAITALPQVLKVVPEAAKFVPAIGKLAAPLAKVAPLAAMMA